MKIPDLRARLEHRCGQISLRLRGVGYCQGMNFLAAVMLSVVEEEERAFHCSLAFFLRHKLSELYHPHFPRLSVPPREPSKSRQSTLKRSPKSPEDGEFTLYVHKGSNSIKH